jgi:thiol-disulfide isomerase/thioredoxin
MESEAASARRGTPVSRLTLCLCLALMAGASGHATTAQTSSLHVTTIEGKSFDLAEHRGKWVVINWWATWCVPCIRELPEISAFVAAHEDEVVAIGLAFDDSDRADIVEFLKKRPVGFPVAQVDPLDPPTNFDPPLGLPNTLVIAPDGKRAKSFLGPITAKDLEAVIATKRLPQAH